MSSGVGIATRDVKRSTACRAHMCGLWGLGKRRLASPMGLGSHVESPSLERPGTALPKPLLLPFPQLFLISPILSGYRCGKGRLPAHHPPTQPGHTAACAELTRAFRLRKRVAQLMPPINIQHAHACTPHVAYPVPAPEILSNGA